ncbi:MAG: hypothetical protein ACRCZP_06535 [Phycicoccus sp.]
MGVTSTGRHHLDTAAARQRRRRAHVKGDHSLCRPERCPNAGQAPEPVLDELGGRPAGSRGPRGEQLWRDLLDAHLNSPQRAMLEEACRIADRLDRLDAMLEGRQPWAQVTTDDRGELRLAIDGLLVEARQQATALRGLLVEVSKAVPAGRKTPVGRPAAAGTTRTGGGDEPVDLAARLAARRGASAG